MTSKIALAIETLKICIGKQNPNEALRQVEHISELFDDPLTSAENGIILRPLTIIIN